MNNPIRGTHSLENPMRKLLVKYLKTLELNVVVNASNPVLRKLRQENQPVLNNETVSKTKKQGKPVLFPYGSLATGYLHSVILSLKYFFNLAFFLHYHF